MPFADLTDVRCHYQILGHGDPLLMIAGLGSSFEKWGNIAEDLANSFTLILVDNRDMGRSVAKRAPHSLSDFTADFVELLDHLQLDRAHVLGLSLGGIIAQRLAIDHPGRVDRLVLVSCTHRFGPYLRMMANIVEQSLRKFPYDTFRRTMELLGTSPDYFDAHSVEIEKEIAASSATVEQRSAIGRQLYCLGCQDVAPPSEYIIQCPTLVISGEHDLLIPPVCALRMAKEIHGSEFFTIPDCGHNPLLEKPAVVLPRIVDFLSRPTERQKDRGFEHMIYEVMAAFEE
jgi:pimeloyl-ACP methyl ester carboxylesterase